MAPQTVAEKLAEFAAEVRPGLGKAGQKELPAKYFYDDVGTALFEVITLLPEYGLTRADARLLRQHAPELARRFAGPSMVAELGSGTGKKTRWVLEALARQQPVHYFPIDLSRAALERCQFELGGLERVTVAGLEKPYLEGIETVVAQRPTGVPVLVLFLGSTIGNFDRPAAEEFLRQVRQTLLPGDGFLLGTDLEKDVRALLLAYDDPLRITAAFNLNLLARINRELEGNFNLSQFHHVARYNPEKRRIEMHLRSLADQTVGVRQADLTVAFRREETIWTESCHKFTPGEVVELGERAGFRAEAQWVDQEWPFAETLFLAR